MKSREVKEYNATFTLSSHTNDKEEISRRNDLLEKINQLIEKIIEKNNIIPLLSLKI